MNRDRCTRCACELIPRSEWSAMTEAARAAARAAGLRTTRAARVCTGCYQALRRRGEKPLTVRAVIDPRRRLRRRHHRPAPARPLGPRTSHRLTHPTPPHRVGTSADSGINHARKAASAVNPSNITAADRANR